MAVDADAQFAQSECGQSLPKAVGTNGQVLPFASPASAANTEVSLMKAFHDCFDIGAAIPGATLTAAEVELLRANFTTVTPENCMKPGPVHPEEDRFNFAPADALVELARTNGLTVNGHTLIWHQQCPAWFFRDGDRPASRERVLQRMRAHIAAVAGHFAGQVKSWDVVNEALDDGEAYLRPTPWLAHIGEDFIAEAFFAARKADPGAELYYNDYNLERPAKRAKALRLIRDLQQRGAPIQGIGIQGHWQIDRIPFDDLEAAILAFHAQGLQVMITELDIDVVGRQASGADLQQREQSADPYADGLPAEVQQRLADQYARLFALLLRHRDKISRVSFWGLHDGRSWLNRWPCRRTNHPLLWDRALQPKPALFAVLALRSREQP